MGVDDEIGLPKAQRGIQSVEIAGRILDTLLEMERPVRMTDLAKKAGISAAKLHRYLISLRRAGLVGQHEESGLYDLGALARRIGSKFYGAKTAADIALPLVRELSRELGETVFIAELGAEGPVSVRSAIPDVPLAITPRIGSVHSLLTSATGRIFAAYLPERIRESLLNHELKSVPARQRAARLEEFEGVLQQTRRHGLSVSHGERQAGINALSAPVFDSDARMVLAITVIGNAATFPAAVGSEVAKKLKAAATRISRALAAPTA